MNFAGGLMRWLVVPLLLGWGTVGLAVVIGRGQGDGSALFYADFQLSEDSVTFYYVDVARGLYTAKAAPVLVGAYSNTPIAPDGVQQVVSLATPGNVDLFVKNPDGTQQQITSASGFPGGGGDRDQRRANLYPAWSPDGAWIAFISSDVLGKLSLFVVRPDGRDLRHVSDEIRVRSTLQPRWVSLENSDIWGLAVAAVGSILALFLLRNRVSLNQSL